MKPTKTATSNARKARAQRADEIICTVPREDDGGWYLDLYWLYSNGRYGVSDTDGNHIDCYARELPNAREEAEAWLEYALHVERTGTDPLGEFNIKAVERINELWHFRVEPDAQGKTRVLAARHHNDAETPLDALPEHVTDYLHLIPGTNVSDDDWTAVADFHGVKPGDWLQDTVESITRRPDAMVRAELIAAAQASVQDRRKALDWLPARKGRTKAKAAA
jgi:hypothetical protein